MRTFILHLEHVHLERAVAALQWGLLCLAFCAYVYCIVMSVVHVVLRKELALEIEHAQARVSELETTYLAQSSGLSKEKAREMGLVALRPVAYVSVNGNNERLSQAR